MTLWRNCLKFQSEQTMNRYLGSSVSFYGFAMSLAGVEIKVEGSPDDGSMQYGNRREFKLLCYFEPDIYVLSF